MRRIAPTVYQSQDKLVVLRHSSGLGRFPAHKELVYVVDDDFAAGVNDATLPGDYRLKLALLDLPSERFFAKRADVILTASDVLQDQYNRRFPNTFG